MKGAVSFSLFSTQSCSTLITNLLSSLTDTYTCNSQLDPSESKLPFELPATEQISCRNPDWRHVLVHFLHPPLLVRLYVLIQLTPFLPSQTQYPKEMLRVLICCGHVVNPEWKKAQWLKSRWVHQSIHIVLQLRDYFYVFGSVWFIPVGINDDMMQQN